VKPKYTLLLLLLSPAARAEPPTTILYFARHSRSVVTNHAETLCEILRKAVGLDTNNPVTDLVGGFNNLWIVEVDGTGQGHLVQHLVLDPKLEGSFIVAGRARGVGDGDEIHDPG
jgi:hypothetical protein